MGWRGGRQNACVWQTWRGYYLHDVIFTKCQCFLIFYKKTCLKEDQVWGNFFFKQNYCHDCHISFTVFFVASRADVLRGSSRVPTSDEPLRGNLVCSPVLLRKITFREFTQQDGKTRECDKRDDGAITCVFCREFTSHWYFWGFSAEYPILRRLSEE